MGRKLRIGLAGCPPRTGNKGVDALRLSVIEGLAAAGADVEPWVFCYESGIRDAEFETRDRSVQGKWVGAYLSRRLFSPDNLQQLVGAARLGLSGLHPRLRSLRQLDALLDVSGGDSFADLYGPRRFRGSLLPKHLALALDVPLVLLPQTYGPFQGAGNEERVREIFSGAAQVWSREAESQALVERLLGTEFDPARHRQTWDVAFGLPRREPKAAAVREQVDRLRQRSQKLVALNVSGLIYNDPEVARGFGFRADYQALIHGLLDSLLATPEVGVLVVPHVWSDYKLDCDGRAARALVERLKGQGLQGRVEVLPAELEPTEIKWAVGHADVACSTRMHAAIAAVSQGVPTVAIAYSHKVAAVFETAGIADFVVDPRELDTQATLEGALGRLRQAEASREALAARLPEIRDGLSNCFESLLSTLG